MSAPVAPNRLVVMAAYDPDGELAGHVRFQIEAWQGQCRRLILVATSRLTPSARDWVAGRAELIERDNVGYDFSSYRTGLLAAGDLAAFDQVVICNDTCVGPLAGFSEIFAGMAGRGADFWGITQSSEIAPHVQSFFVVFERQVVASAAFRDFWQQLTPESNRWTVIVRYEVGLSRALQDAGFVAGSSFVPTRRERLLARARMFWQARHRHEPSPSRSARWRARWARAWGPWNPMCALADSALDAARLPMVKLQVLREDPYHLDAERLWQLCQQAYPDAFAGLDAHLGRTAQAYRKRVRKGRRSTPRLLRPLRRLVSYR